jgi:hypothetical protein
MAEGRLIDGSSETILSAGRRPEACEPCCTRKRRINYLRKGREKMWTKPSGKYPIKVLRIGASINVPRREESSSKYQHQLALPWMPGIITVNGVLPAYVGNPGRSIMRSLCLIMAVLLLGCGFSKKAEQAVCGNGTVEMGEVCDGADLNGQTCEGLGLPAGVLRCLDTCLYDASGCTGTGPACGNDVAEEGEVCDGDDLAGESCVTQGFAGGVLDCTGDCSGYVTTGCTDTPDECGDGIRTGPEECDGTDLGGQSCAGLGLGSGDLGCTEGCTFDTSGCAGTVPDDCNWIDMNPRLEAVWAASPSSIWALPRGGGILHYDTFSWTMIPLGSIRALNGIWGRSDTDIFAVGDGGRMVHLSGGTWNEVDTGLTTDLTGIWGQGDQLFVVSEDRTLYRIDGESLTMLCYEPGEDFRDVWGFSPTSIFMAGTNGAVSRWDGSECRAIDSPSGWNLAAIAGTSETAVYVVGYGDSVVWMYDGSVWDPWDAVFNDNQYDIRDLWAEPGGDLFAVGSRSYPISGGTTTRDYILRYDGATWSPTEVGSGHSMFLGIWGTSPDFMWVWNHLGGVIQTNGIVTSALRPDAIDLGITNLWGFSDTDLWIPADWGQVARFDGNMAWTMMETGVGYSRNRYYGIWGTSPTDVYAVGWDYAYDTGTIGHFTGGTSWAEMDGNCTERFRAVWGPTTGNVWAVAEGGLIRHYNGSFWLVEESGTTEHLKDVWGPSAGSIYIVGYGGTILHSTGDGTWSPVSSGTDVALHGLWGTSDSDMWVVGEEGTILRDTGSGFVDVGPDPTIDLFDVIGTPTEVFAVGGRLVDDTGVYDDFDTVILRWDGSAWTETTGDYDKLYALWSGPGSSIWAGGIDGALFKRVCE